MTTDLQYMRGKPKKEFNTPTEIFFHCSEQFLNKSVLMFFSASAIFCFTSSTQAKCLSLRTFVIRENKKQVDWGEIR